jgi:hypothetical protein
MAKPYVRVKCFILAASTYALSIHMAHAIDGMVQLEA